MTELSGARYRAGFGHYRQQFVYNLAIPRAQETLHLERQVHTAEHLASAIFFLGAPIAEIPRAKLFPPSPAPPPSSSALLTTTSRPFAATPPSRPRSPGSNRCSPVLRSSSATIPDRPTWPPPSGCPPSSSSAPATPPSGDRGGPRGRRSPRPAAAPAVSRMSPCLRCSTR